MSNIHKSAIIDQNAIIGDNVSIGAYTVIEGNVKIADNNTIKSSVYITGNTEIGSGNIFHPFCSIGSLPQDLKFDYETTYLRIGSNNTFREYSNVNLGTKGGGGLTQVGNNSLLSCLIALIFLSIWPNVEEYLSLAFSSNVIEQFLLPSKLIILSIIIY